MRGTELMKHYRLRWESIAFPDMGLTEIVDAETVKDAKVKADFNPRSLAGATNSN